MKADCRKCKRHVPIESILNEEEFFAALKRDDEPQVVHRNCPEHGGDFAWTITDKEEKRRLLRQREEAEKAKHRT